MVEGIGGVDSTNYNQTSMVRSIKQILGPLLMNQFDAPATPLANCFADQPDEETPNRILWHSQKYRDDTCPAWAVLKLTEEDEL